MLGACSSMTMCCGGTCLGQHCGVAKGQPGRLTAVAPLSLAASASESLQEVQVR